MIYFPPQRKLRNTELLTWKNCVVNWVGQCSFIGCLSKLKTNGSDLKDITCILVTNQELYGAEDDVMSPVLWRHLGGGGVSLCPRSSQQVNTHMCTHSDLHLHVCVSALWEWWEAVKVFERVYDMSDFTVRLHYPSTSQGHPRTYACVHTCTG